MKTLALAAMTALLLVRHCSIGRAEPLLFEDRPRSILQSKCFACHGEDRVKRKAELDLRTAASVLQGGESGAAVVAGKPDESLLWRMIDGGEMPPQGSPSLTDAERQTIQAWIAGGAQAKNASTVSDGAANTDRDFWSFGPLKRAEIPGVTNAALCQGKLDRFVLASLEAQGLTFADEADRRTLARRVYLDLIGLPPTPEQTAAFLSDHSPDVYEKLVDQLLASPHYGERWGRQWLDVVGYADSNGYIRHDSPRPLAYRYRDYVIRSFNADKPYDRFWLEQLAGDELVNYPDVDELSAEQIDALVATHFLRNAPDGTDDTEGNEATRVMERYAVLEGQLQITMSAMFGMTIDCARCHSHKFDPIPQRDYYALQAIFSPAFNVKEWTQPKNRWIYAAGKAELSAWKSANAQADQAVAALRQEFENWLLANRPAGQVAWQDNFSAESLSAQWTDVAPGDDRPAGAPAIHLDGSASPGARIDNGRLALVAATPGDSVWLITKQSFAWAPERLGEWIQLTFDLVDNQYAGSSPAERIGYYVALHDHDDSADKPPGDNNFDKPKGNILIDGDPAGGAQVFLDYPGKDQQGAGRIGTSGYQPGHNYGVRITRVGKDEFLLQQLVDGKPEEGTIHLTSNHLPAGGAGFELCCGRSFIVDRVVVECSKADDHESAEPSRAFLAEQVEQQHRQLAGAIAKIDSQRVAEPEKLAWVTDLTNRPPEVPILKRGDYFSPGAAIDPGTLSVLVDDDNRMEVSPPGGATTGRRLALARWATKAQSRAAALLARVEIDRIWRGHFGRGLVPTPDNFGASGVPPTHPELLDWLAAELIDQGWRLKPIHRQIVLSRTYRQTSNAEHGAIVRDADNLLYSRFPGRRADAETIRDSMLAAAGVLNPKQFGPAVEFIDRGNRQITLAEPKGAGPHEVDRRSIYLRHRRSQPISFLQTFDQALPEPNCIARQTSTVVAQSLAMLNGEFAVRMGREFANRLQRDVGADPVRQVRHAFQIALSREPSSQELDHCTEFLAKQRTMRSNRGDQAAAFAALADFCRMLVATNEFAFIQ